MNKEELLQQIKDFASQGLINKEEIISIFDDTAPIQKTQLYRRNLSISNILYFIGAAIVFIGISVLIGQNWGVLNTVARITVTFGSGIAAYCVGVLFSRYEKLILVGDAFYFISALVTPIGLHVIFDTVGFNIGSNGTQSLISGMLFAMYIYSFILFKRHIFTIFSVIFGTWLFFSFTNLLVLTNPYFMGWKFVEYRVLLTGLSYMLLGYYFSQNKKFVLAGTLNGFGVMCFLGAALALGGWSPKQSVFWELFFPALVFGVIFLSIYVKSRAFLIFGSIYLMGYILKITAEYFSRGLGWPLALVLAGFSLIAIGYFTFYLNKKYLT